MNDRNFIAQGGPVQSLASAFLLATIFTSAASAQTSGIDVAFVMDGSGSISGADFALQKQGLIAAIQNTQLVPTDGSVALSLVQFASGITSVEVPYTLITTPGDLASVASQIASIGQIGGCTNPGDGVSVASSLLNASGRPTAKQSICLSTDGTPNCGGSLSTAVAAAKASPIGIDTFGVIGIECPGVFSESDLLATYGPLVFGDGTATMVFSSLEFANTVGSSCFGDKLELVGLEVIQSVQDWKNTVMLVEGKLTYVRAHVKPADPSVPQTVAQARLRAFTTGGSELAGSPIQAINPGGQVIAKQSAAMLRGDWDASLNFRLPTTWTHGTIVLRLEAVGAAIDCSNAAATNMDCETTVSFESVAAPEVRFIGIKYKDSSGNTIAPPQTADLAPRLRAVFPVASVSAVFDTTDMTTASTPPTSDEIISKLNSERFWDGCFSLFGCDTIYYGVLDGGGGGKADGCPSYVSFGYLPPNNALTYGYNRHAHEITHNLDFGHAAFCGAVTGGTCTTPLIYSSSGGKATLGPVSPQNDAIYGLDTKWSTPRVIDPSQTFAMMSYCGGTGSETRRWIAAVTYEALIGAINGEFAAPSPAFKPGAGGGPFLVVSGRINQASGNVAFEPFHVLQPLVSPPAPIPGEYAVRLENKRGALIDEVSFAASTVVSDSSAPNDPDGSGQDPGVATFIVPLDLGQDAQTLILSKNGAEVARVGASANAPTVAVTFPNGGEVLDGLVPVSWVGNDRDGDALSYIVQFSPDGGLTWDTLVVDWPQQSYEVDFGALSGTASGLVRVLVSDGFLGASDDSDAFFVTDHPPQVAILSPQQGDEFFGVQTIFLAADANDVEDGALDGASVVWSSDIDGLLTTGSDAMVNAGDLTPANHVITVVATDSVGNQTSDSVQVAVETVFQEPCVLVDFESDDTGPLVNGQVPLFGNLFTLSTSGPNLGPAAFDSSPTGPNQFGTDPDLLVNLGHVLILQENPGQSTPGVFDVPDDDASGGEFVFDFAMPSRVESIDLIDVCPIPSQTVELVLLDSAGATRTYVVPSGWTTDVTVGGAGFGTLDLTTTDPQVGAFATATASESAGFNADDVVRLRVKLSGSGGIDNLRVCAP